MEARAEAIADGHGRRAGLAAGASAALHRRRLGQAGGPARARSASRCSASGRGGQFTYHGPGQRVAYVMLDLTTRGRDVRAFVQALQGWIIDALAGLGVDGEVRDGRVGVWVSARRRRREDKIAAIGVKLRRWVSFHGVSLNVDPDLAHFDGIVPCGVTQHGVTSLADLGAPVIDGRRRRGAAGGVRRDVRTCGRRAAAALIPAPA